MDATAVQDVSLDTGYWKRNLIVCFLGSVTTIVAMTLLLPFLPLYVEQLGVTDHAAIVQWSGIAYGATFLTMYLLITRGHHQPFWQGVRWIWPKRKSAVAGLVALGVPLAITVASLENVLPMPSHVPFEKLFTGAAAAYGIGFFAITIAPLMEELFFRGFLYPVLRRFGSIGGVTLTSLAFAVLHGSQYGWGWSVGIMFLVGLVLTIARAWSGSVVPGFLIHAGYNLSLFVSLYIATDHFQHLDKLTQ